MKTIDHPNIQAILNQQSGHFFVYLSRRFKPARKVNGVFV